MAILSYNYQDVFKNILIDAIQSRFNSKTFQLDSVPNVFNFINTISTIDQTINILASKALQSFLEKLDDSFRLSPGRTKRYHVKAHHNRTIMTVFGLVTYCRTFYSNTLNKGSYCYVDTLLGLKKYDHFDPYIKSLIVEAACNNSFAKAGKHVSAIIGNRIHIEKNQILISRQTVKNCVLKNNISTVTPTRNNSTPETLFIMMDEKFVHTQNNKNSDIMVKHAVVFEKIELVKNHKSRNILLNKYSFASSGLNITKEILDYIYDVYDIDKIKTIYILGDGASWIKNTRHEFNLKNNITYFALDKYHAKQALRHITLDNDLSNIVLKYILNDEKMLFIDICNELITKAPHREETISKKKTYILNHWGAIKLSYHHNLSCSMEGHISHNIASQFSSIPKGYSKIMLMRLLRLRMSYKNGLNIKKLFLNNFNKKEILILGKDSLDFSSFDSLNHEKPFSINKAGAIGLKRKRYYWKKTS